MNHPTPQTTEELLRECIGTISRVCADMERCATAMDIAGLEVQWDFLTAQRRRLDTIRKAVRQPPRKL